MIRRNAAILPAYSFLLGLLALVGYLGVAAGVKPKPNNEVVPALFNAMFPAWFQGFAFGIWILQALPAVIIGLYTRWFHRWALVGGWAVGMLYGTWAAWSNSFKSVGPPHLLGITTPLYPALTALVLNLLVAVVLTGVFSAMRVDRGRDETAGGDYEVEATPPIEAVTEGATAR
ncbi:MAG TPA: hypothetical protein VKG45_00340 [Actinomycetes bacterium]|nr:hypothetical protein [Actinomycetes bacterium]